MTTFHVENDFRFRSWCFYVYFTLVLMSVHSLADKWHDETNWSEDLGKELWDLSKIVTKYSQIKPVYSTLNSTAIDGKTLLRQIKENVETMLRKKRNAVKCIVNAAEDLRKSVDFMDDFKLEYYNMKYSLAEGSDYSPTVPWKFENLTEYKNMSLEKNHNFYNIPVNINYSAVHIPTNVYDRYVELAEAITWSEDLNDVFLRNYHADPALSWQYFGSTYGMMRQYPAMQWNINEDDVDLYDCRTRPWFIEAATCTKDVIILMDNSGSMTGMRNTIAKLVVNSLLKTFGNNDFISVLKFSWKPESVLPCYKDSIVQATPETIKAFQDAVSLVKPEGNASFPNAFAYSLKLMEKYRKNRGCNNGVGCNQVIMLVTDGLPNNVTEVFENLNLDENGMPIVRVFTYLVGTEVKGVQELQLMACQNRGYYVHIHDLDEVHDQVLKYIPVVARPLVLQGKEHPPVWTHVFADINDPKLTKWLRKVMNDEDQENRLREHLSINPDYFSQEREDSKYVKKIIQTLGGPKEIEYQEYRMMTSISIPAFDKRENNETRKAELLGVAGTDVPVSQIYSLTFPYKTGANGYVFIVTNNGYLLMHPDLRPVFNGTLKLNYDSVDLAEVEFIDEDREYKEYSPDILAMRKNMVDQIETDYLGKIVKFHYDDMHRIGTEKKNFYIAPLSDTSYSIGLVVPSDFAAYRITSNLRPESNEVNSTSKLISIDKYLKSEDEDERDPEWIIHPDWTYCKYHFDSYKTFDSKEDELLHFLERVGEPDWEWKEQYQKNTDADNGIDDDDNDDDICNQEELAEDAYYCHRDLVEFLITDAQILSNFRNPRKSESGLETLLLDAYNPNLRFVATQSGLTKWQLIPKPQPEEDVTSDFIKAYPKSVDETWYKMAVLQNRVDDDSFVFSVPFQSNDSDSLYVVATHAIFHRKTYDGKKAAAAVLGYRFKQSSFYERFMKITSVGDRNTLPCDSFERECYLLDHNGYIVVSSKTKNETGQFFGEIEGFIMSHLVELGIFEEKIIYDYQGLCQDEEFVFNAGNILLTPFRLLHYFVIDFFWNLLRILSLTGIHVDYVFSIPADDSKEFKDYDSEELPSAEDVEEDYEEEKEEVFNTTRIRTWPCDKRKTLYLFRQKIFSEEKNSYGIRESFSRFLYANRIPHTNLLLVVLNTSYSIPNDVPLSVDFTPLPLEECTLSDVLDLPRKRLPNCFTHHPDELEVEACGKGYLIRSHWFILFLSLILSRCYSC